MTCNTLQYDWQLSRIVREHLIEENLITICAISIRAGLQFLKIVSLYVHRNNLGSDVLRKPNELQYTPQQLEPNEPIAVIPLGLRKVWKGTG